MARIERQQNPGHFLPHARSRVCSTRATENPNWEIAHAGRGRHCRGRRFRRRRGRRTAVGRCLATRGIDRGGERHRARRGPGRYPQYLSAGLHQSRVFLAGLCGKLAQGRSAGAVSAASGDGRRIERDGHDRAARTAERLRRLGADGRAELGLARRAADVPGDDQRFRRTGAEPQRAGAKCGPPAAAGALAALYAPDRANGDGPRHGVAVQCLRYNRGRLFCHAAEPRRRAGHERAVLSHGAGAGADKSADHDEYARACASLSRAGGSSAWSPNMPEK